MALVFQYGSNCSSKRLNSAARLNGAANGWAETLESFELQFDVWSTGSNCAAADVVPGGDAPVQGVLYQVPDELLARNTAGPLGKKSFDVIEGAGYERRNIHIRKRDGVTAEAITYIVRHPVSGLKTSTEYVAHIIVGLREHGADDLYIEHVKSVAIVNNAAIAGGVAAL